MKQFLNYINFKKNNFPWFLLGIAIISFGLLTPWLGFYQDDWHHIFYFSQGGAEGLKEFLFTDSRPFAYWVYIPLFKLLGLKPISWQIYALLTRYLIVFTFWGVLNQIWQNAYKRNAIIAAIFLVYPVFMLQPMSVMFALHWTMYLVYMVSVLLMFKAIKSSRYFFPLFAIALLLEIFHLLMMEYFVGLELLRPIFLFVFFREATIKERLKKTLKTSIPFVAILVAYIIFRSSYSALLGYDRNTPIILFQLFQSPLPTIGYLIQTFFQDFAEILFTAWYDTLEPSLFSFGQRNTLFIWLGVVLFSSLWGIYFSQKQNDIDEGDTWAKEVLFVGFFAILFGVAPGWAVAKTVHGSNPLWNDRFAMASMFGAAMFLAGFFFLLLRKNHYPILVLGVMVSLAMGANMRSALEYKRSWEKQQKFYWQLYWRAPEVEKQTVFIADSEFVFLMGVYPTSFAINTLYQDVDDFHQFDYWLYIAGEHLPGWESYRAGEPLEFDKYASSFRGNTLNALPIFFLPEALQCLWVLGPEDEVNRNLPGISYEYISVANLDSIKPESSRHPLEEIFGTEPEPGRCYYFEKAALARQYANWEEVTKIWNDAEQLDLLPYSGVEYVPFIQAFAHTGDWDKAEKLTLHANRITERMSPFLCDIWLGLDTQQAPVDTMQKLSNRLSCEALLDD